MMESRGGAFTGAPAEKVMSLARAERLHLAVAVGLAPGVGDHPAAFGGLGHALVDAVAAGRDDVDALGQGALRGRRARQRGRQERGAQRQQERERAGVETLQGCAHGSDQGSMR